MQAASTNSTKSGQSRPFRMTRAHRASFHSHIVALEQQYGSDMTAMLLAAREQLPIEFFNMEQYALDSSTAIRGTLFDTPEAGEAAEALQRDAHTEQEENYWGRYAEATSNNPVILERVYASLQSLGKDTALRLNRHHSPQTLKSLQASHGFFEGGESLLWNPAFKMDWTVEDNIVRSGDAQMSYNVLSSPVADLKLMEAFNPWGDTAEWSHFLEMNTYVTRELIFQVINKVPDVTQHAYSIRRDLHLFDDADELVSLYWHFHENLRNSGIAQEGAHHMLLRYKAFNSPNFVNKLLQDYAGLAERYRPAFLIEALEARREATPTLHELAAAACAREQQVDSEAALELPGESAS